MNVTSKVPSAGRWWSILEDVDHRLGKRLKLIKIADSSAAGWNTVDEYNVATLGSDSDDEKKIRAAERRALASRKTKHTAAHPTKSTTRYNRFGNSGQQYGSAFSTNQHSRFIPPTSTARPYPSYRTAKPTDICLGCGGKGHWRRDCPNTASSGKNLESRYGSFSLFSLLPQTGDMHRNGALTTTDTIVKGRLKNNLEFWKHTLNASPDILNTIRTGYRVCFTIIPEMAEFRNNASALRHEAFVDNEIRALLKSGCIVTKNTHSRRQPLDCLRE